MSKSYGSFSEESNQNDHTNSDSSSSLSRKHNHNNRRRQQRYNNDYHDENTSSSEDSSDLNNDDFDKRNNSLYNVSIGNLKTGRERRKKAARGKGGEFYEKRRKRRVYVCTLADEIDVIELKEHIQSSKCSWITKQVGDALILSKQMITKKLRNHNNDNNGNYYIPRRSVSSTTTSGNIEQMLSERERSYISNKKSHRKSKQQPQKSRGSSNDRRRHKNYINFDSERYQDVSDPRHQEVMVFEFGAVVFWGFSVGEESVILQTIKDFAAEGQSLVASEFTASEDDMAFISHSLSDVVVSGKNNSNVKEEDDNVKSDGSNNTQEVVDLKNVIVANDVISFPEKTTKEHRLAVSYAIAQSSIVAIFEERIIQKVADYKFIPETLASVGKIDLSTKSIGMMIGEIFVIRHDLNLHSDILDTPDFFWGEQDRHV